MTQHKMFKCPNCKRELNTNWCPWCSVETVTKPFTDEAAANEYACEVTKRFSSVPDKYVNRHDVSQAAKLGYLAGVQHRIEKPSIPMGILYGRWGDGTLGADWWYDIQAKIKKETISRAEAEGYELVYEETDFMMFKKKE